MTKARTLADFISDGSPLADGTISVSEVSGAAPLANPTFTGTASGTFSGPLTGAVTGNVTGDLTGNVTGNVTGDLTGNVTAPFVSLVGTLPTLDFSTMLLQVAVSQATDPVAVGTWFDSTASDGYKYGDLDKSGSIGAQDGLLMNQLSAGLASEAVTSRWYNIIVPSLVTQSWYADLVTDGTILAGGTLDLTNGWTIEQEAGNFHVSKDNVTKLDIASDGALTTNSIDLSAIAATISDTAVDIFVYDTRKDSDGGAWRKRTQGTSWYNETLNTATRGSRKEFPAVAVIVAESNQVTIYDGDDPDLPMWMVFNRAGDSYFASGSTLCTSVVFFNGLLVFGVGTGTREISFLKDSALFRTNSGKNKLSQPISGRNSGNAGLGYDGDPLVNSAVNDVAMTVLPNAPIDAATGLPVPTIAVATNGGTSVIRDDGTVVDVLTSSGQSIEVSYNYLNYLWVTGGGGVAWQNWLFKTTPTSDGQSPDFTFNNGSTPPRFGSNGGYSINKQDQLGETVAFGKTNASAGPAVHLLNDTKMVAFIDPDYNTGWMNGDIKLATLSDTDDTNVTGSELVTNGTFDSDTSGWTPRAGTTATVVSGRARVSGDGTGSSSIYPYIRQAVTTVVGKTYTVTVDFEKYSSGGDAFLQVGLNGGAELVGIQSSASSGTLTGTFVATGTSTDVTLVANIATSTTTGTGQYFDNISVRLAEEDRSVNGNGLQVFGTVTKSAVATGADLVGYSGFNASNYLKQPYNSDLDFGTGDFAYSMWFKKPDATAGVLLNRSSSENSDSGWGSSGAITQAEFNGTYLQMRVYTNSFGGGSALQLDDGPLINNTWTHFVFLRSGGQTQAYINGVLQGSIADTNTATNTSAKLWVGNRPTFNNRPFNGSIALFRASATAPSPEQIKKIYEDEKVLFQENAQATLYGSSDAVTALAYDDTTELLHVGTSAGRSVFQGLRRVDNTTDAVGAAISASNGLVAED